ncbi:gamma-glutamyl peptidase 5-like [Dioscorea cayenensis subsp. rotundata]|uniref:Gamma-glutamyl peptidase 5-like n=1 Tax=Dioscorea cayennensis subsp. rotundata TaxID=55577 RepID=A0AB40CKZ1_DIOCR|nr:gamma-glutamyl peptidase 5-like [Dioscorea cayenensis subsp. rotundata]
MEIKMKRYAVLLCAEDSEYIKKVHGGYFQVFKSLLGDEDQGACNDDHQEIWDSYKASNGELPKDDDEIAKYDGFIITGSIHDAHGNDLWVLELIHLLKKLDFMKKKVLGICFGHQILCRALGGKIGKAEHGWDLGATTINFTTKNTPSLVIMECHRDEIWELPAKAELLAWSEKTRVEMFKYGEHIMGIQGHPEYTKDIVLHIIGRLLNSNVIQTWQADAAKLKLEDREPDQEAWKKLCKGFLKG